MTEQKKKKKEKNGEINGENSGPLMLLPINRLCQFFTIRNTIIQVQIVVDVVVVLLSINDHLVLI